MNNQAFYDIQVNNYTENSNLSARMYQDKTCSIRIKKDKNFAYNGNEKIYIKAFIERADRQLKGSNQFKIAFDYKNNRLHFNVRKGGVITTSISRRILKANGSTEIVFDNKDDIFYAQGKDIWGKFNEMFQSAMGLIQIINHNLKTKCIK